MEILMKQLFQPRLLNLKFCFPRQSLTIFTFRVKLSDSIFFLLGYSPIVKLIYCEILKRPKNEIITLKSI